MDKYYKVLAHFSSLDALLESLDIADVDVVAALEESHLLDVDLLLDELEEGLYDEEEEGSW